MRFRMGVYFSFSEGLTPPSLLLCRPPGLLAEGKGQRESKPYKLSQLSKPSKPSKPYFVLLCIINIECILLLYERYSGSQDINCKIAGGGNFSIVKEISLFFGTG